MKLEYSLAFDDFLKNQLYFASKSESAIKKRRNSRIITPIIYYLIGLWFLLFKNNIVLSAIFIVFALLWVFFYPIRSRKLYINHYKKYVEENYNERINKTVKIEITPEYILTKDDTGEGKILTKEVESLIETKDHFFMRFKTKVSIVIPKQKIKNINEFKSKTLELKIPIKNELNWKFT